MAAPLSLSRAEVTTPDQTFPRVSLLVRQNRATLKVGADVVAQGDVAVDGVNRKSMTTWTITLADGTEWNVKRARGCGCGGG